MACDHLINMSDLTPIKTQKLNWVSPNLGDYEIFVAKFLGDNTSAVVIAGTNPLSHDAQASLTRSGFESVPGRRVMFARRGGAFKMTEVKEAFPAACVVQRDRAVVYRDIAGTCPVGALLVPQAPATQKAAPVVSMPQGMKTPQVAPRDPQQELAEIDIDLPIWNDNPDYSVLLPAPEEFTPLDLVNEYQVRYRPASNVGNATTMVPVNMARPLETSFRKVKEVYGDVDELVAEALGWTYEMMASRLAAEQIDAVADFVLNMNTGRALILADQTGIGKGRVVAACALAALNRDIPVIFLTETANLFSDFWRDIRDIDAEYDVGEPFIMNSNEKILDISAEERVILFSSLPVARQKEVIESKELPPGCRFVFATYSQFSRPTSPKVEFLKEIAKGAFLIEDESHNAAGASNVSAVIDEVENVARCCLYSSATFAAKPENMKSYQKALPDYFRGQDVVSILKVGGQVLQSALAQGMTADGRLLRREHDLSGIAIEVIVDYKRAELHRQLSDCLSPILSRMSKLSRRVGDQVDVLNERNKAMCEALSKAKAKEQREYWTYGNFGGRLSLISQQFLTSLHVDLCVERSLAALNAGEKVVVVIDITMESVIREILSEGDGDVWADHPVFGDLANIAEGVSAPSFGDALAVMLRRILTLKVRRHQEKPAQVPVEDEALLEEGEAILAMIRDFPFLPISPMDAIREAIEAEKKHDGTFWAAGEITGRSLRVSNGIYEPKPQVSRNEVVIDYNSGKIDLVFITRPGSAGLSLHASERVRDKRRRVLIEVEIPRNPVNRIQRWGRVNRRGQVSEPRFETLSTALPYEVRNLAIQNRKVADLSAQVTANADSASLMANVPDILNSVGNEVCKRLLTSRPQWADDMDIALQVEEEDDGLYFVNKFLFRLILLPSRHQEALYQTVLGAYEDALKEMAARGLSPRKGREMAGQWRVVERKIFDPGEPGSESVLGGPVFETQIASMIDARPVTEPEVLEMVKASRARLAEQSGRERGYFHAHIAAINEARPKLLEQALSKRFRSVEAALNSPDMNAVKQEVSRLAALRETLEHLEPGIPMSAQNEDGEVSSAVIVDIIPPDLSMAWFPGKYHVRYLFPGDETPREISIAGMQRQPGLLTYPLREGRDLVTYPAFRNLPAGKVEVVRRILDGNIFLAVRHAVSCGFGTTVSYRDEAGERQQGVLVPKSREKTMNAVMRSTRLAEVAFEVLRQGNGVLWTNPERSTTGLVCRWVNGNGVVTVREERKRRPKYATAEIVRLCGGVPQEGRGITLPPTHMFAFLKEIVGMGDTFFFEGKHGVICLKAAAILAATLVSSSSEALVKEAS